MNFEYLKMSLLRFTYAVEENILMPVYKGSVLRGGLGAALRKVSCVLKNAECDTCMLKANCAYSKIFETPIPEDSKYLKNQEFAPHPFVLEPPLEEKTRYIPGDEIVFQLLLIGYSVDFVPYFILAFELLAEWGIGKRINGYRGRCFLKKVESVDYQDNYHVIYTGNTKELSDNNILSADKFSEIKLAEKSKEVNLEFITPTRVKSSDKLQNTIDFEMLIRALIRRILILSYFHCNHEPEFDYNYLITQAQQKIKKVDEALFWRDWSRPSSRQNMRMMLGGFKGKVTFSGFLQDFIPLLLIGEYIHVGKGTAFGLGKYVIS
ncbi:CRISPR system precrRNA processing endoribonuclease RAMP protein Cas6 [Candidatus Poribacteria bacterium]|nr:CRISPR system precrRNA processing endoribonuclease RAMP protein Cas6 [Candidatus Poribacteria bacterium]